MTDTATPDDWSIRDRVLDGLAASIRERGYALTRVGDIVRVANTSRRTLYEIFPTEDDCVAALLDRISDQLCDHISSEIDSTAPWAHQVREARHGTDRVPRGIRGTELQVGSRHGGRSSSAANGRRRIEDGDDVRAITEVAVQAAVNTLGVTVAILNAPR